MIRAVVYEMDAFEKMHLKGSDIFWSWTMAERERQGLPDVLLTLSVYGTCSGTGRLLLYEAVHNLKGARYGGAADLLAAMNKDAYGRVEDFKIKVKEMAARLDCGCYSGRLEEMKAALAPELLNVSSKGCSLIIGS